MALPPAKARRVPVNGRCRRFFTRHARFAFVMDTTAQYVGVGMRLHRRQSTVLRSRSRLCLIMAEFRQPSEIPLRIQSAPPSAVLRPSVQTQASAHPPSHAQSIVTSNRFVGFLSAFKSAPLKRGVPPHGRCRRQQQSSFSVFPSPVPHDMTHARNTACRSVLASWFRARSSGVAASECPPDTSALASPNLHTRWRS